MENVERLFSLNCEYTKEFSVEAIPHYNGQWEITLFPSGNCDIYLDEMVFHAEPYSIIITGLKHKHSIVLTGSPHNHIDIYIRGEEFLSLTNCVFGNLYEELFEATGNIAFSVSPTIFFAILNQIEEMKTLQSIKHENARIFRNSVVCSILGQYIIHKTKKTNNIPPCISNFINMLQNDSNLNIPIRQLVEKTNYSYSRFSALFKLYIKKSIIDYVLEAKMTYASNILISTKRSVLDISLDLGYFSVSSFCTQFKKYYHISPREYRKKNKMQYSNILSARHSK